MNFKSCKKTFNHIDDNKKRMILSTAIDEFAQNGFNSSNINVIAEKSNISIGAMYKYFDNKRALYLTCVEWAMMHLSQKIDDVIKQDDDTILMFEKIIRTIQEFKEDNDPFTKLYYEMATESNAEYAMLISSQVEGITSNLYAAYIEHAKSNGLIRKDIDSRFFAFFIDNLLMMLQFSYSCEYYKDRMKIYTYPDVFDDNERLLEQMMLFVKGALFYKE
ncbi:MAG: TetR/AcrR family transcriptional regulator [Clostridia bacterium]|nr:TetR/AcrR family transcriptional regulator [Clostridia bacterium]